MAVTRDNWVVCDEYTAGPFTAAEAERKAEEIAQRAIVGEPNSCQFDHQIVTSAIAPAPAWKARDLPPFDETADCPKCASGGMSVIFHGCNAKGFPCETIRRWVIDGHLCRICERCGYGWCEAAVDTKPARRPDLRAVPAESNDGDA